MGAQRCCRFSICTASTASRGSKAETCHGRGSVTHPALVVLRQRVGEDLVDAEARGGVRRLAQQPGRQAAVQRSHAVLLDDARGDRDLRWPQPLTLSDFVLGLVDDSLTSVPTRLRCRLLALLPLQ